MASRAVHTLLASRNGRYRPHRVVVRVGAAAAWFAAAAYLAAGAFTSDENLLVAAVGPVLAASLMTIQVLLGREDGGLALFGSGLIVGIWHTISGYGSTLLPAAVSLVLIAALGMVFVNQYRTVVAATLAASLLAIPQLWDLSAEQQMIIGVTMALGFLVAHLILGSIQDASIEVSRRYQMLFEESPAAALEEDWSEAIAYVSSEYSGKPTRIRQFLLAYPEVVRRAVSKAKVVRANEAALHLLDIGDPARFLGYRDPDAVTDENIEAFVSALVTLYEGGKSWEREIPIRTRAGERRWLLYRTVDTSSEAPGSSIVAGLADITHMKARNEAMAQAVRSKDEFIANISHELRTPLTVILGITSELTSDDSLADEERSELLQLVSWQASEMANIVEDLLVAARADVGTVTVQLRTVDLVAELLETINGLGVSIEMPTETPPPVHADPHRVRQILRNLLTNAQRYGGPRCRVVIGALRDAVWLEVRDNGDGIPDEESERIFEPYVTSGARGSVGLGLSVSRQLAELMGGTLHYERSAAESVFRLQLPIADLTEPVLASHSDAT
ncbi:MAG TPA: HAMP domain-containing sensor histidine kinase [Acidimicrobiia bacterium]